MKLFEKSLLTVVFPSGITHSKYISESSGETRQYGFPSFQGRDTKLDTFFPKQKANDFASLQFFHSAKMALLIPCMKFKKFFGQNTSFEAL